VDRKIKFIWDFRGPDASQTAKHHAKHLQEYTSAEKLALDITGYEDINEMHSIAFMVVQEQGMIPLRDTLKPHRGEVWLPPEPKTK